MALITRVSRLFKADFNAVLDQIEEPEMLLKLAIREMEDSLNDSKRILQARLLKKAESKASINQLEQKYTELDSDLDACFESQEEDLARTLIRRKLETRNLTERIANHLATLDKEIEEQQKVISENQSTLMSMRQKAALITERTLKGTANDFHGERDWSVKDAVVNDSDVEIALLQEKKRRAGL